MPAAESPAFPPSSPELVESAANRLRALALNEAAKDKFCHDPRLRPFLHRVSRRYVAGQTITDVVQRVSEINAAGHAASAEYMGESCRDEAFASAETEIFVQLAGVIGAQNLNCSISFDLSHVGSVVDPELGYRNARRIARACAAIGQESMISMEGSDRADLIYATYERLHREDGLHNVGITVPAKLHRTASDLPALMQYSGRIRLVKGAFLEPEHVAYGRSSAELASAYRRYAKTLLESGHRCSIATHDPRIHDDITELIARAGVAGDHVEFETLIGLGTQQIATLRGRGFATREYAVFGQEHFLYVLNRIAEEPVRVYQALIDLIDSPAF
jgi:proline dehydrogenase